ncbi:MAG: sodium:proton antiporter [Bacteroidia bacterium]|nr:sodium:proton antiporter [Bacteroidia bacterium]
MNLFAIFSILVVLAALFAYLNVRFLKLPGTIGLLFISILFTVGLFIIGKFDPKVLETATDLITRIDFRKLLMDFMLCFLLFAGALHTNFNLLLSYRWPILIFATFGVVVSAVAVGYLFWILTSWVGLELDLYICLVFGALISPTDPVAVLGILKKANVPKNLEVKIVGESLFNDGIGVVIFLTFLGLARQGLAEFSMEETGLVLLEEVGGGIALGLLLGYGVFLMLRSIDHYETEVLITLAAVVGGYSLAAWLGFSGPLAMVIGGLFMGNEKAKTAMSATTQAYLEKFWELVDVLLNAILFVLIGLEMLVIQFQTAYLVAGLIAIPLILIVRFLSLGLPVKIFQRVLDFAPNTGLIMTWAGIRGGISIALALSIPDGLHREILLPATYIVVVFSILVQGLTLGPLVKKLIKSEGE